MRRGDTRTWRQKDQRKIGPEGRRTICKRKQADRKRGGPEDKKTRRQENEQRRRQEDRKIGR